MSEAELRIAHQLVLTRGKAKSGHSASQTVRRRVPPVVLSLLLMFVAVSSLHLFSGGSG